MFVRGVALVAGALLSTAVIAALPAREARADEGGARPGAPAAGAPSANKMTEEERRAALAELAEADARARAADWSGALVRYEAVARRRLTPGLLFLMARCHEELGRVVAAVEHLERALELARREGGADDVEARAPERIAALRARLGEVALRVSPKGGPVAVRLDGAPVEGDAAERTLRVDPGEHTVSVEAAGGGRAERTVRVGAGETVELAIDVGGEAPRAPPGATGAPPRPGSEPTARGARHDTALYVAGGVALALGAGALVTGLLANARHTDYEAANAGPSASRDEREALRAGGRALAVASTALTGGALVAAGVTVYLVLGGGGGAPPTGAGAASATWVGGEVCIGAAGAF